MGPMHSVHKGVVGKVDTIGRGHRHGGHRHRHFQKALLHLYNSYFSYLTLFLQQPSLPDPGAHHPFMSVHAKD